MISPNQIETRIRELEDLIKRKTTAVGHAPVGTIHANPRNGITYFDYICSYPTAADLSATRSDQQLRRRLNPHDVRDQGLLQALAQKDYDEKILKAALQELSILKKLQHFYLKGIPEDIYDRLTPARQKLVLPIRPTDAQYAEAWLRKHLPEGRSLPDDKGFKTNRGERVRSKSEMMIANMLLPLNPNYIYERALLLTDHLTGKPRYVYPDFCVLNVRTRKEYLYEHFGKMGDPDYVYRNLNKLIDYANAGYIVGKNLVLTMESLECPLTPEVVETVIREYFL